MQGRNSFRVGKRVATTRLAARNCAFDIDLKRDVVKAHRKSNEGVQKPRPDDAIHNHKVAALRIALCRLGQHLYDRLVLFVRRFQKWRDRAVPDEVPEVIAMKMYLGRA